MLSRDIDNSVDRIDSVLRTDRDKSLKYCIIASIVLHLTVAFAVARIDVSDSRPSFLKDGEKVTPVSIVNLPDPEPSPKPPEQPAAMSDRDHIAERTRIPQAPPARAPLGSMEPMQQHMAALTPPPAPDELEKAHEEKETEKKEKEEEAKQEPQDTPARREIRKPTVTEKPTAKPKPKPKPTAPQRQHSDTPMERNINVSPSPAEIARGLAPFSGPSDFSPDGDKEEVVIDINTQEDRFASYLIGLKRKIEDAWVYPSVAAKNGVGGTLAVEFSIARDGNLIGVKLLDSSGHNILDQYALNAIREAAPYYPFPDRMRAKRLRIRANFIYMTSNIFRRIL